MRIAGWKPTATEDIAPRHARIDFGARFVKCYRVLWLIAAGIVQDRTAAEDVVQEAALIALGKLDQFQPDRPGGSNFTAWMSQMVRFVALNHSRKIRHRQALALDPEITPANDALPRGLRLTSRGDLPSNGEQDALDDHLVHALHALGETARCCLLLRTIEGLPYAQIAQLLEIPEGTAMSHVHRSRMALRGQLTHLTSRDRQGAVEREKHRPLPDGRGSCPSAGDEEKS